MNAVQPSHTFNLWCAVLLSSVQSLSCRFQPGISVTCLLEEIRLSFSFVSLSWLPAENVQISSLPAPISLPLCTLCIQVLNNSNVEAIDFIMQVMLLKTALNISSFVAVKLNLHINHSAPDWAGITFRLSLSSLWKVFPSSSLLSELSRELSKHHWEANYQRGCEETPDLDCFYPLMGNTHKVSCSLRTRFYSERGSWMGFPGS